MKIPDQIKINSHIVHIERVEHLSDRIAEIEVASLVIHLARTCGDDKVVVAESMTAEGLLHEIIHFITISNGYGVAEKLCTCIAHNLLGIIRDNKLNLLDRS